jgi:glycosyltransferase involved in cell wall biosynthesis
MVEEITNKVPLISFIMPAHNEEDVIEATVKRCLEVIEESGVSGEVVVANDGSKDRTGEILDRLALLYGNVKIYHLSENSGYGVAMKNALHNSSGEFIATIDSDGQFEPADAIKLLKKAKEGLVCVTGFRAKKKDSLFRVIGNYVFNLLVRILCRVDFKDSQCAIKVMNGNILRNMHLESKGYMFPTEVVFKTHYSGYSVGEIGVSHYPRAGGESSLKLLKTSIDMLLFLLYMRMKLLLYRRKLIERL